LFAEQKLILDKLKRFKDSKNEHNNILLRYCPKNRCEGKMYAKDMKATKMQCPICSTLVCFECKEEWHEAVTCDAAFIMRLGP
jgi:hypothetical protein